MPTFDVAVIGAGVPGLAAAVLLARANRRVVVIDPGEAPGGMLASRTTGPARFSAGPLITHGFGPGGALRYLYAAAGLAVPPHSTQLTYQVALPDRRVTVFSDQAATLEELCREFPREIDRISLILSDLSRIASKCAYSRFSSALARRRSAAGYLLSRRCSRELNAYFSAQTRFFFGQPLEGTTLAELAEMASASPVRIPGGWNVLAARLRDVLTSLGGEYRTQEPWPALHERSRRIASIRTTAGDVSARTTILNSVWQDERSLLIGLKKNGVPVGMAPTVICQSAYDDPQQVFALTCFTGENGSDEMRDLDPMTVTFLPHVERTFPDVRLLDQVRNIIPFIDAFTVNSDELDHWAVRPQDYDPFLRSAIEAAGGASFASAHPVKQLHLLQDRTYALPRPIEAACRIAAKLA